ncbi:unnamed protein product [Caenorhabditis sp. 36 PRJEB53466]|nr:unnamed protein product [Caenorhabditis sp. 36 PRJEB53466]
MELDEFPQPIPVLPFRINSSNLVIQFNGDVLDQDMVSLKKNYSRFGIGFLKYSIGQMAKTQEESMKEKTLIFDVNTFLIFPHCREEEEYKKEPNKRFQKMVSEGKIGNIFDKELLIFTSFEQFTPYITFIFNPKSLMLPDRGGPLRKFHMIHISIGDFSADKVYGNILTYIDKMAEKYENGAKFNWRDHDHVTYNVGGMWVVDRTFTFLGLLQTVLNPKGCFSDLMNALTNLQAAQAERRIYAFSESSKEKLKPIYRVLERKIARRARLVARQQQG